MLEVKINECFKPIFGTDYRYLIYKGGRSSGKSWGIADSLLIKGRSKFCRILCTREIQRSIKQSSHKLLKDRINHYGFNDYIVTDNSIKNSITGTEFIFSGLSDVTGTDDSLKSIEGITDCWVEEAQNVSERSFKILTPSIRGNGSIIIISYNPDTEDDPVHKMFVETPRSRSYIKHINYLDNKHCPIEMIEEAEDMRRNKPEDYENIWLGVPRSNSARAVVKYFTNDNIKDKLNYCEDLPVHLCMDYNVGSMAWGLFHTSDDKKKFYFFDELAIENTTTQQCINELISRYPNQNHWILNGDASGKQRRTSSNSSDIAIVSNTLREHGCDVDIDIPAFNPQILVRVNAYNEMVMDNKGNRNIFIHSRCKEIIKANKLLKFKVGTSIIDEPTSRQLEKDKTLLYSPHMFDAISYPAVYYNPIILD